MPRPNMHWSDDMLAALKRMRMEGQSYLSCAERVGVCADVIAKKCKELGLNRKMNRGFISGPRVIAKETDNGA